MDVVRAVFAAFTERDVEGVLAHSERRRRVQRRHRRPRRPDRALPRPRRPAPVLPRRGRGLGRAAHRPAASSARRATRSWSPAGSAPAPRPGSWPARRDGSGGCATAWSSTPASTPRRPRRWRRSRSRGVVVAAVRHESRHERGHTRRPGGAQDRAWAVERAHMTPSGANTRAATPLAALAAGSTVWSPRPQLRAAGLRSSDPAARGGAGAVAAPARGRLRGRACGPDVGLAADRRGRWPAAGALLSHRAAGEATGDGLFACSSRSRCRGGVSPNRASSSTGRACSTPRTARRCAASR